MSSDGPRNVGTVLPTFIDTTKPSIARVYDAFLNGKDNYEVDREMMRKINLAAPEAAHIAFDSRDFLIRVTRFIAQQTGVRQFLDLGSGLPTAENTHQVAQRVNPDTTVVYIDKDPVVIAHGRALLEENDRTHFTAQDIFEPEQVLADEVVRKNLDFSQPIALFQMATFHHYGGERTPRDIMRTYIDALAPGSIVGLSHFLDPEDDRYAPLAKKIERILLSDMSTGRFRTRAEIADMLPGLDLIEPGLVLAADWWPDGPRLKPLADSQHCVAGAVARKP
ncbi:SAM-dependent methyltransferase [Actinokineospora sp. G85]|uniref:SAM-dependent methyltransferase n=1 Tax=Actinokineospora sp. G85 TaxID=3406626 RepID=UPI003C790DFC